MPEAAKLTLRAEIEAAMQAVRSGPQAIEPRMALFQLAAVCGDWRRAKTQLETMEKLDRECAMLARTYGRLIDAEVVRQRVFAGDEQPVAFGHPPAWLAMMAQALTLDHNEAQSLREAARQDMQARSGRLDAESEQSHTFDWIMDADPRMGAALEVVVDGQYRWLPLEHLAELRAAPPKALRDVVWQPVTLRLNNETEMAAFVPARYPGSETCSDDAIRRGTQTRWIERDGEQFGLGQRMLASNLTDHAFLDVRRVLFADV